LIASFLTEHILLCVSCIKPGNNYSSEKNVLVAYHESKLSLFPRWEGWEDLTVLLMTWFMETSDIVDKMIGFIATPSIVLNCKIGR